MSRVAVIGSGYVGLTTGVCLAYLGHDVTCADIDEDKVASLNRGEVTILEQGLERLLADGLRRDRLRFVVGAVSAVAGAEFVLLCVPTPQGPDGAADLSFIAAACHEIRSLLPPGCVVISKSTVPDRLGRRHRQDDRSGGHLRGVEPGVPSRGPRHT